MAKTKRGALQSLAIALAPLGALGLRQSATSSTATTFGAGSPPCTSAEGSPLRSGAGNPSGVHGARGESRGPKTGTAGVSSEPPEPRRWTAMCGPGARTTNGPRSFPVGAGSRPAQRAATPPGLQGPRFAPAAPVPDGTGLQRPPAPARVPAGRACRLALPVEHRTDREGAAMSDTATSPATGAAQVCGEYNCDEGRRQLVAQRINGRVALTDIPVGDHGKVYLIERHVPSLADLEALEA